MMASADLIRRSGRRVLKEHPGPGQASSDAMRHKTAQANLDMTRRRLPSRLAMLRAGRGLMSLKGYRPADGRQHKTVVDLAGHFLGKAYEDLAYQFERMRRKRNQFTYEPDMPLGLKEAQEALETAREFVRQILSLARKESPQLELGTED